jgi:Tol biopolymer transport system component
LHQAAAPRRSRRSTPPAKKKHTPSPCFFPDGRHFAYTVDSPDTEHRGVYVGSLDSTDRAVLLPTLTTNIGFASGRLVSSRGRTLVAQPFDVDNLRVSGEPEVLADDLARDVNGPSAAFAVSLSGRIAYVSNGSFDKRQLTWVDRAGRTLSIVGEPRSWTAPAIAPDGRHLLLTLNDPLVGSDLWLFDLSRGALTRFTSESEWNSFGRWSPDGSRIVFSSDRTGVMNLYEKPVDGSTREHRLLANDRGTFLTDWSADGQYLLFEAGDLDTHRMSAWIWRNDPSEKPSQIVDSRFNVTDAALSADMRWIAYALDESGRNEIYVQRFPDPSRRVFPLSPRRMLVSTTGGTGPRWRRDGRELFYTDLDGNVVSVDIKEENGELREDTPAVLFNTGVGEGFASIRYAVAPDGQRFLVARPADSRNGLSITVLTDWTPKQ